jgi:hypothetical protein
VITGEPKSKIDAVWNDFWSGGISNPLEVMEQLTYNLIAVSFFVLAGYVAVQAIIDLVGRSEPSRSKVGIALAVASLIVMPVLARAKRRDGVLMGSATGVADSSQTKLCASPGDPARRSDPQGDRRMVVGRSGRRTWHRRARRSRRSPSVARRNVRRLLLNRQTATNNSTSRCEWLLASRALRSAIVSELRPC